MSISLMAGRGLLCLALLASALSAGFFYTYSISVMPGLRAVEPAAALRAMQGINAVIRTPIFAFAFFGTFAFLIAALPFMRGPALIALAAAAAVYAAGVLAVTFLVHIPMNEALGTAAVSADNAAGLWQGYGPRWTAWNHVRAAASALAFALTAAGAVLHWRG